MISRDAAAVGLAGFLADSLFLTLLKWFDAYCFLLYAGIAFAGGAISFVYVPETTGRTLAEVQVLLSKKQRGLPGSQEDSQEPMPVSEAELSSQTSLRLASAGELPACEAGQTTAADCTRSQIITYLSDLRSSALCSR